MTQSTTQTEATAPTGDIKIFVDTFNKEFDTEIKFLSDKLNNLKNVYNDAIKITTPRTSTWPKDENVKTIGDLFKYTFPDIEKGTFIKPPSGIESNGVSSYVDDNKISDYKSWEKDLTSTQTISQMFNYLKNNLRGVDKLNNFNQVKKPGVTNPNLYSPGQYYFDVFMSLMLSESGPIKKPNDGNGGGNVFDSEYLKTNGTASISIFDPSGEVEISKHTSNEKFDYYEFYQIISRGYSGVGIKYRMSELTGINIDLDGDSVYSVSVFPNLRVQYRSGNLSELKKDPKFNEYRGEVNTSEFVGNYEQLLLYKAFVQAGDNYKPIVLPYRNPEPEPDITDEAVPATTANQPVAEPVTTDFIFNVEKTDTFIIVGGSQSGLELVIVTSDVTESTESTNSTDDYEDYDLDDEYREEIFQGSEELAIVIEQLFELQSDLPANTAPFSDNLDINIDYTKDVGDGWKKYNIDKALSKIKSTKHGPSSKFEESLKKILFWMKTDSRIKTPGHAAYLLGTAYAESGYSLQRWEADYACTGAGIPYGSSGPCSSATSYYRSTKGGKKNYYTLGTDSKGQCYFGRGLIQLTGKANYDKYGKLIGVDLISNGDLAMREDNSYKIASIYLSGRTFQHIDAGNLTKARRSVNGGTKGISEVNGAFNDWLKIFNDSSVIA